MDENPFQNLRECEWVEQQWELVAWNFGITVYRGTVFNSDDLTCYTGKPEVGVNSISALH